ncbi:ClpP-like protease [Mycobacterium phage Ejimix]|uniref:ATP-dependent Clp protease proteolytic subunit n=1 Tax=Acinetobacter baumannii TaxID=470 RepID=A0AAJ0VMC9_ACIBA|nr:ATP-dependent Clp protease proteolytic subunit [Acinetobacter baumannii]YP_008410546.1 head maturation protease [Mycobacterium phage Wanda]YP_009124110.1 head maturation protease [Mycobacterium phage Minerva]ATN88965.1 ClpP-like protease [Mycobacterium phage DmpstrDiver]AWH13970.1 ClpP-like protease [Mycobacterium phage Halley]AXQ52150.1 ClpP-like protease [Mycobacterium phage Ejimix]QDP43903.1 ClpP-like protease [Mycobacterium phage Dallas]QZD98030.1 ClpP-like protease [Mycobacterium pha
MNDWDEARKKSLELQKLELDVENAKLDLRRLAAEAEEKEHQAALAAIRLREAEAAETERDCSDAANYTYRFADEVDDDSIFALMDTVNSWHRADAESKWNLIIDSPGGYCNSGFHAIDQLIEYSVWGGGSHYITMTVRGMAASMGGIILQAADERVMGRNAQILIHPISSGLYGGRGELHDYMGRIEMLTAQAEKLFKHRAGKKLPRKKLKNALMHKNWWIGAEEALEYALVDRIG